jgi:hypothetical protein
MLALARWILTGLFVWLLGVASGPDGGGAAADVDGAIWMGVAIGVGMLAALCWAPVLSGAVAGRVGDLAEDGSGEEERNRLMGLAGGLAGRGWRRLALLAAFLEGVRHPDLPAAFHLGMGLAKPGTWLEKVFAKEVWRFSNLTLCLRAHEILTQRHGIDPGPHARDQVNDALKSASSGAGGNGNPLGGGGR